MKQHPIHLTGLAQHRIALIGNPNCGKTTLFNKLTGSQQKVANYAGTTVDIKRGLTTTPGGRRIAVLDLPGAYSLNPGSDDEAIACSVVLGKSLQEKTPSLTVVVIDATRLRRGLRLVAALQSLKVPLIVALTMTDRLRSVNFDPVQFSQTLGVPVVIVSGISKNGDNALLQYLDHAWPETHAASVQTPPENSAASNAPSAPASLAGRADTSQVPVATAPTLMDNDSQVQTWLQQMGISDTTTRDSLSARIDKVVLHPVVGSLVLAISLFLMFQAVFSWAEAPIGWIENGVALVSTSLQTLLPDNWVESLVVDGILAGVGGVLVFLPQILFLTFFILVMEESGYLPRAALLLDRMMAAMGLSGRAFIPLLSSFACAIPGIMAARTIGDRRARWVTILVAPLMACSARLPVYALLIAAFIPNRDVGIFNLQGLVMFGLYALGVVTAIGVAWVVKLFVSNQHKAPLMMELPDYHWPRIKSVLIGLWQRAQLFLRRVGGIILILTIVLWLLSSFPAPPPNFSGSAIEYSFAGQLGSWLAIVFAPIGFNWQISVALIPGLAAREVIVSALNTVYALSQGGDEVDQLTQVISNQWSLATGMALLIWFVFAPQCLATLATVKRESKGWGLTLIMVAYLFGLAYLAAFITYQACVALGWG